MSLIFTLYSIFSFFVNVIVCSKAVFSFSRPKIWVFLCEISCRRESIIYFMLDSWCSYELALLFRLLRCSYCSEFNFNKVYTSFSRYACFSWLWVSSWELISLSDAIYYANFSNYYMFWEEIEFIWWSLCLTFY